VTDEKHTQSAVPEPPGLYEPVVVDWLAGREWPTAQAVAVTMLDLGRQGVLTMEWGAGDIVLTRNRAGRHDFEARILDLIFHRVGRDREQVNASEIREWIDARPDESRTWWDDWETAATQHTLRALRNAPRGISLPRRKAKRDRDHLLDRWQEWADELALTARAPSRHPDELARWARAICEAVPLNQAVAITARIEGDLSLSERATLCGGWCPIPMGARMSEALEELLKVLPRLEVPPSFEVEG